MADKTLTVTLVRSKIGNKPKSRGTLRALGPDPYLRVAAPDKTSIVANVGAFEDQVPTEFADAVALLPRAAQLAARQEGALLADIAGMVGRKPPTVNLPRAAVYPVAFFAQLAARVTGRQPFATIDGIRMSRYRMFFSDRKARAELGFEPRVSLREGLRASIASVTGTLPA